MGLEENAKWKTDRRRVTGSGTQPMDRCRPQPPENLPAGLPPLRRQQASVMVTGLQRFSKLIADGANRRAY